MKDNEKKVDNVTTGIYQKKVSYLKQKIIISVIVLIIFVGVVAGIYKYYNYLKNYNDIKMKQLISYISNLKSDIVDIEARINEAKKYRDVWKNTSDQKKNFDGIKKGDVSKVFTSLATNYGIDKPSIQISVPETLKGGIYDRRTVDVLLSFVTISFETVDDVKAATFIQDFINSIPGYVIINNFSVDKTKIYNESDIIDISLGKMGNAIAVKLEFSWYVFKKKQI